MARPPVEERKKAKRKYEKHKWNFPCVYIRHGIEAEARAQTKSAVTQCTGRRVNEKKDILREYFGGFSCPVQVSSSNTSSETSLKDMPPRRKRKAATREETKLKKQKEDCLTSIKQQTITDELGKPFSLRRCRAWFEHYAAQDEPDTIGPEGVEKLCKDLGVEPEDSVMLVIAWKLQAATMGFFTFHEWSKGMLSIECDSTAKLKAQLNGLKSLTSDSTTFKKIYRYAFDFCRNQDQRTLEIDTAMAMMNLLLHGSWSLLDDFVEFLQNSKYKVLNRDQWCNVLEFSRSILPDLSNYDEDGAWPVLMDEFVLWYRQKYPPKSSSA